MVIKQNVNTHAVENCNGNYKSQYFCQLVLKKIPTGLKEQDIMGNILMNDVMIYTLK